MKVFFDRHPRAALIAIVFLFLAFVTLACDEYDQGTPVKVPPSPPTVSAFDRVLGERYNRQEPVPTLGAYPCGSKIAGCQ